MAKESSLDNSGCQAKFVSALSGQREPISFDQAQDAELYERYLTTFFRLQFLSCVAKRFLEISDLPVYDPALERFQPLFASGNNVFTHVDGFHELLRYVGFQEDVLKSFEKSVQQFSDLIEVWTVALADTPEHLVKVDDLEFRLNGAIQLAEYITGQFSFFDDCSLPLLEIPETLQYKNSLSLVPVSFIAHNTQDAIRSALKFVREYSANNPERSQRIVQFLEKKIKEFQEIFETLLQAKVRSLVEKAATSEAEPVA